MIWNAAAAKSKFPGTSSLIENIATKLALIGIDMYGESLDKVKPFMAKVGIDYPVAIGNDAIGERFHVEEMPLTLLIDRSGRIAVSHAGIADKAQFENDIQELLQSTPG